MKQILTTLAALCILNAAQAQSFELIKDINPSGSADIGTPFEYNGKLYFSANDGTSGRELWVSDGTAAGTGLVNDINPTGNSFPKNFFIYNNLLFFVADDGTHGNEWWYTDGTSSGTQLLADIGATSPSIATLFNGKFYFVTDDGTNGYELWSSDGTTAGTQMVKNINPGSGDAFPGNLTVYNNQLFFNANDGNGNELWVSDGTTTGTQLFKDIYAGSSQPSSFIEYKGDLYFTAYDNFNSGSALWKTDGTVSGTQLVKDPSPSQFTSLNSELVVNNTLFLTGDDSLLGSELWLSDGTPGGTSMIKDIYPGFDGSGLMNFFEFNNTLFFTAKDGINGTELWVSDGTLAGTNMLKDINTSASGFPFTPGSELLYFKELNNRFYFAADEGNNGFELWSSDGTSAGTIKHAYPAASGNPNNPLAYTRHFTVYNGDLYFAANYDGSGIELWKFNPSPTSVESVQKNIDFNIYPNPASRQLNINCQDDIKSMKIIDLTGRTIQQWDDHKSVVDISSLNAGMYFLQIQTERGIGTESFVKK